MEMFQNSFAAQTYLTPADKELGFAEQHANLFIQFKLSVTAGIRDGEF